jgi:uncharacterized membrane protein (DUF106 family)
MIDVGMTILAIIGAIYIILTAAVLVGDHRRRMQDYRYTEDQAFRRFVEAMKRAEQEEDSRG